MISNLTSRHASEPKPTIDIVVCTDRHQFIGLLALIRSVILNTERPEDVFFHLLTEPAESGEIRSLMERSFRNIAFRYEIREFHSEFPALVRYVRAAKGVPRPGIPYRAAIMNCSRFYLSEVFPQLDKVVYLDADTIVQSDVRALFEEASLESYDLAAVARNTWGVPLDRDSTYFRNIDFERPAFNAGVFVTRLAKWRENQTSMRFEYWMDLWSQLREKQARSLFTFGSQVIMNAVFHKRFEWLSEEWNLCGLGYREDMTASELRRAGIVHWTGGRKPWMPDGLYQECWEKYSEEAAKTA